MQFLKQIYNNKRLKDPKKKQCEGGRVQVIRRSSERYSTLDEFANFLFFVVLITPLQKVPSNILPSQPHPQKKKKKKTKTKTKKTSLSSMLSMSSSKSFSFSTKVISSPSPSPSKKSSSSSYSRTDRLMMKMTRSGPYPHQHVRVTKIRSKEEMGDHDHPPFVSRGIEVIES